MAGVKIEIRGADETVARMQELADKLSQTMAPLFQTISEEWVSHFKQNIRQQGTERGGGFTLLTPFTQRQRKAGGYGEEGPILIRTGDLLQSIQALEVTETLMSVGTRHESAALLHFGGKTSPASMMPDRDVPKRPFIDLSEEAIADTMEMIEAYFFPTPEVSAGDTPRG